MSGKQNRVVQTSAATGFLLAKGAVISALGGLASNVTLTQEDKNSIVRETYAVDFLCLVIQSLGGNPVVSNEIATKTLRDLSSYIALPSVGLYINLAPATSKSHLKEDYEASLSAQNKAVSELLGTQVITHRTRENFDGGDVILFQGSNHTHILLLGDTLEDNEHNSKHRRMEDIVREETQKKGLSLVFQRLRVKEGYKNIYYHLDTLMFAQNGTLYILNRRFLTKESNAWIDAQVSLGSFKVVNLAYEPIFDMIKSIQDALTKPEPIPKESELLTFKVTKTFIDKLAEGLPRIEKKRLEPKNQVSTTDLTSSLERIYNDLFKVTKNLAPMHNIIIRSAVLLNPLKVNNTLLFGNIPRSLLERLTQQPELEVVAIQNLDHLGEFFNKDRASRLVKEFITAGLGSATIENLLTHAHIKRQAPIPLDELGMKTQHLLSGSDPTAGVHCRTQGPFAISFSTANSLKQQAAEKFKEKEYHEALKLYQREQTHLARLCPTTCRAMAVCLSNQALMLYKLGNLIDSLSAAQKATSQDGDWTKPFFHMFRAYLASNKLAEARQALADFNKRAVTKPEEKMAMKLTVLFNSEKTDGNSATPGAGPTC